MSDPKLYVESSHGLPLVSQLVAFRSGSAHDPVGKEGLSRVTARMLRRGAEGYSATQIEETVDTLGGEFGADVGMSSTSVQFEVIKRSLDPFAALGAVILSRPAFDEQELERLLRETAADLVEARDSDASLCSRGFRRALFAGHPYGRRVAGTLTSLRAITRDDVVSFYRTHYTRRNAVVALSGDVDRDEATSFVDRILGALPEGERIADPVPPPVQRAGRHLVFVDKPERTQTQITLGSLGTSAHDPDHIPLLVANAVFGGSFTSRLMQEVRVKRGWSYGAYSRAAFDRQREAFSIGVAPAAGDAADCLVLILQLLQALCDDGVTEDELRFVKSYLVRSHAFEVDTARKRVHQALEEELFDLPSGYHENYVARVQAVTRDEANTALRARLDPRNLVISMVGTHAEIGQAIQSAIPDLQGAEVLPPDFE
ncbi:M16 family metallopeptidase [Chondromyces crocatus]|uniref:Peptidase M16 n=1 Tax=Chondromyces crocatus TaxID=52 RepID=A0A0K1EH76_CHOCO|nr:pitrilysin family protein [Chondromyces crocatus]AKT39948.1 uncharacterized protein CMC5_041010 [Chondromyces crocatus]